MKEWTAVDWKFKGKGKKFRNGTWLCVEFNKSYGPENPCAEIHR
jgi:hypothetical protein